MQETFSVLNQMQSVGIIGGYAIGGAVGATFCLEPVATLDLDVFVVLQSTGESSVLTLFPIYEYLLARGHPGRG